MHARADWMRECGRDGDDGERGQQATSGCDCRVRLLVHALLQRFARLRHQPVSTHTRSALHESLHLLQLKIGGVGVALGLLDVVGEIAGVAVRLHVARQMSHVKDDTAHCKICVVAVAESGRIWGMCR